MNKLINFSIKHPLSIISYSLIFLLTGIISTFTIPIDFLPVLSQRTILVSTQYPSLPAKEISELITIPVEDAFSSLNGIKNISSTSRDNISLVKIQLHYGININRALIESNQIIDDLIQQLPEGTEKPKAEILNQENNKLLSLYITPEEDQITSASFIVNNEILHSLDTINGIGRIQITGTRNEQILIKLDIPLMNNYNISTDDVYNSLVESNYEYPAGTIQDNENEYSLKTNGSFNSITDVRECYIYNSDNIPYKLKQFASVEYQEEEPSSITLLNNRPCIKLDIYSRPEVNPIKTSNKVKNKINEYKENFINYDFIILNDRSIEIKKSIILILISSIISIIITFTTIYYFYRNCRIACILSVPIPASILFSITILKLTGRSLNLISLSGISISIGMVVDAAIVICDNLIQKTNTSLKVPNLIQLSIIEVRKSTVNSALTTILVFIPFFLIPGIFGELFSDFSIGVISSIFCSVLISFTLIPSLLKLNESYLSSHKTQLLHKAKRLYSKYLSSRLNNHYFSIILIITSILISLSIFLCLNKEFSPSSKNSKIIIQFDFPSNKNITYMTETTQTIIKELLKKYDDITITSDIGIDKNNFHLLIDPETSDHSTTLEIYTNSSSYADKIISYIKEVMPDVRQKNIPDYISQALNNRNMTILFFEQNKDEIFNLFPNAIPNEKVTILNFNYDINKCSIYHLNPSQVVTSLYRQLNGFHCGVMTTTGISIPIIAKSKASPDIDSKNISILLKEHPVPLSAIGTFTIESKEKTIFRYDRKNAKIIYQTFNDKKYNSLNPEKESFSELLSVSISLFILVFLILYLALGAQFESYMTPLILLSSIIPGISGSFFLLFCTHSSLNVDTLLSLIIVSGISINNSIILIESKNYISKISSILITTVTSLLALIPFMFFAKTNPAQAQISFTLTGGIVFSFFSSLLTIPNLKKFTEANYDK